MRSHIYHFGDFSLDPLSRELNRNSEPVVLAASAFDCLVYLIEHRERPVGKDELISAVWARADVSENLVAQTIVRLRRAIDESETERSCIKTIVRVGYRWMLNTTDTVETRLAGNDMQPLVESDVFFAAVPDDKPIRNHKSMLRHPKFKRSAMLIALLMMFALSLGYFISQRPASNPSHSRIRFDGSSAIVLPVDVDASDDWKWLHFGLMEMISDQLRDAKVPSESSHSVISLLNQSDAPNNNWSSSFALVISPHVSLLNGSWRVRLDASSKDGRTWQTQSSSADVLVATRTASDMLLAHLGFNGVTKGQGSSGDLNQEYLLRIEAAELAYSTASALELIKNAPLELQSTPELLYLKGRLYCKEPNLSLCEQTLSSALKQLIGNEKPVLKAKILTAFWYIDYRHHRLSDGKTALNEAVRLLLGQKDTESLATAYMDRSRLEYYQGRLDEAASDLGNARANFILAGDTAGQAQVEYFTGKTAVRRANFAEALPLMQQSYELYQRLGMRELIAGPLGELARANKMLLKFPDELAVTDKYWPFKLKGMNFSDGSVRTILGIVRATALADNGRRAEAIDIFNQLLTQVDTHEAVDLHSEISASLAELALEHGDSGAALSWISQSMKDSIPLDSIDERGNAKKWLVYVDALQRNDDVKNLDSAVASMEVWAAHLPVQDDWVAIQVMRARATQLWGEGKNDQSLEEFKNAMTLSEKVGVPELVVSVGLPYEMELLNTGHMDQAIGLSGRFLSSWSSLDWRAAWAEANVFKALGQQSAWETARTRAQRLAGDRLLPDGSRAFAY